MTGELTPDDVREILRLVDEAGLEDFELETPRLSVRVRRSDASPAPVPDAALVDVTAPMVATFYRAPAPGEPPFVEVGTTVEPATTVCILEVMKLMHSVTAGVAGIVAEVCREDATPVQYGDVLFRVRPA